MSAGPGRGASPCRQPFKRPLGPTAKERWPAWRALRGCLTRRGSPRVPRGLPRLPLWGFTCALPHTPRKGPLTRDAAAPSRLASPTRGWRGLTEVDSPPYPTFRRRDHPGRAPSLEPRGTITARVPDAGDHLPAHEGLGPSRWDSRRVEDLERDLEDAQATCQALSSEQQRRVQEVLRARAYLRRAQTDLSAMRRDHTTLSAEWVRQRSRTTSLEEEGSRLHRQVANAQPAAHDVVGWSANALTGTFQPSFRLHR